MPLPPRFQSLLHQRREMRLDATSVPVRPNIPHSAPQIAHISLSMAGRAGFATKEHPQMRVHSKEPRSLQIALPATMTAAPGTIALSTLRPARISHMTAVRAKNVKKDPPSRSRSLKGPGSVKTPGRIRLRPSQPKPEAAQPKIAETLTTITCSYDAFIPIAVTYLCAYLSMLAGPSQILKMGG